MKCHLHTYLPTYLPIIHTVTKKLNLFEYSIADELPHIIPLQVNLSSRQRNLLNRVLAIESTKGTFCSLVGGRETVENSPEKRGGKDAKRLG
jgi:hypothetical protein